MPGGTKVHHRQPCTRELQEELTPGRSQPWSLAYMKFCLQKKKKEEGVRERGRKKEVGKEGTPGGFQTT